MPGGEPTEERDPSIVATGYSGPIPPPGVLADYDKVVDRGAERIMAAWEQETAHRRELERRDLTLTALDRLGGKLAALVFVLAALGVTAYCASIGAQWVAAVLGAGTIGTVVWAFVKARER